MVEVDVRPAVARHAVMMESRLKANDWKGGWEDCRFDYLFARMGSEVHELMWALHAARVDSLDERLTRELALRIVEEAADVANFAMMLADKAQQSLDESRLNSAQECLAGMPGCRGGAPRFDGLRSMDCPGCGVAFEWVDSAGGFHTSHKQKGDRKVA